MKGGDYTAAQIKILISTLLPPDSVYAVYFGSSMTNSTLLNATNMGGSSSGTNAFTDLGSYTISLPLSQVKYQPVDVMLIIDRSGSMGDTDGSGKIKINLAKSAAKTFVHQLNMSRDRVGLASFSTDATLDCYLTNNAANINNTIDSLNADGWTNIGGGISKSNQEFINHGRLDAAWIIILLSDGVANYYYNEQGQLKYDNTETQNKSGQYAGQYAIKQSESSKVLKDKGVRIYTIGLGSSKNLDEKLLKQIAFDESKYYHAPTADQLESIYIAISKDILLQVRYDVVIIQLNIFGSG
jgi:Mg-chelatase subunit ChlD